ncbi:hypothetical protein EYS14_03785 [Alteromonadaceae bacterium M269]|nr:hypothetical protein EYS14_03785 [Alteromonadaceae bacterium M269]
MKLLIGDGKGNILAEREVHAVPRLGDTIILRDSDGHVIHERPVSKVSWDIPQYKDDVTVLIFIDLDK